MPPKILLLFIGIALALCSCRSDFETVANRRFSVFKDTIYLDTVFSNIGSSTYRLKVYNKSKMTSTIPSIKLGKGLSSKYRMTIDGMQGTAGKIFYKCSAVSKRCLYVFIETTVTADANQLIFCTQIKFSLIAVPINKI
jgi:hypothetical protein